MTNQKNQKNSKKSLKINVLKTEDHFEPYFTDEVKVDAQDLLREIYAETQLAKAGDINAGDINETIKDKVNKILALKAQEEQKAQRAKKVEEEIVKEKVGENPPAPGLTPTEESRVGTPPPISPPPPTPTHRMVSDVVMVCKPANKPEEKPTNKPENEVVGAVITLEKKIQKLNQISTEDSVKKLEVTKKSKEKPENMKNKDTLELETEKPLVEDANKIANNSVEESTQTPEPVKITAPKKSTPEIQYPSFQLYKLPLIIFLTILTLVLAIFVLNREAGTNFLLDASSNLDNNSSSNISPQRNVLNKAIRQDNVCQNYAVINELSRLPQKFFSSTFVVANYDSVLPTIEGLREGSALNYKIFNNSGAGSKGVTWTFTQGMKGAQIIVSDLEKTNEVDKERLEIYLDDVKFNLSNDNIDNNSDLQIEDSALVSRNGKAKDFFIKITRDKEFSKLSIKQKSTNLSKGNGFLVGLHVSKCE